MRCVNANDALVMFSSCDKERIDLLVCNYVYDGERLLYASTDSAGDAILQPGDMKVTLQHQSTPEIILTAVLSALKRCTAVFVKTIKSLVGIKHVLDTRRPRRMRHDLDRNAGRM